MERGSAVSRLSSGEVFDVLVIGGGAVGLGSAVDAAARGLRTALVERSDFACGTSSRSTKLVHGGVRYLKQGNLKLVSEGLRERGRLRRNAPDLVHALPFVIPCYQSWEKPFYGAGMKVYDLLAGRLGFGKSHVMGAEETKRLLPGVATRGLRGGVMFRDGQFDDARLALALMRTARRHGGVLANYCSVTALLKLQGRVVGAEVRDEETGRAFPIRARAVINATGVFVDAVRRWDEPEAEPLVAVSQGIHLVLPREFLPGGAALLIPRTTDGRILFAVPWEGKVVLGTTDTPMHAAVAEPRALPEEKAFLLEHAARHLERAPSAGDVLSVFAGLRPLVQHGRHASQRTASLSREHAIVVGASGLITVTGGKWTTYRQMGEDVIDRAASLAGLEAGPSATAALPLAPRRDEPEIAAIAQADSELAKPVTARLGVTGAEVVWSIRREMARTVEDVLARRTRALFLDALASVEAAPGVAGLLAKELGRDDGWVAEQVARYADLARGYLFSPA